MPQSNYETYLFHRHNYYNCFIGNDRKGPKIVTAKSCGPCTGSLQKVFHWHFLYPKPTIVDTCKFNLFLRVTDVIMSTVL